jgi:hypothetical protein
LTGRIVSLFISLVPRVSVEKRLVTDIGRAPRYSFKLRRKPLGVNG